MDLTHIRLVAAPHNSSRSIKLSSQRRIEASRANGAKSHGPATPQGLQISSRNALRHGLTAQTVVLTNESVTRFEQLLEAYVEQFRPRTEVEMDFVEEMAVAKWRQRRTWSIESATLDYELDQQDPELTKKFERVDHPTRLVVALESLHQRGTALQLIGRYETRLNRHFERALRNLYLVQAKNNFLPNEPNPVIEHLNDADSTTAPVSRTNLTEPRTK